MIQQVSTDIPLYVAQLTTISLRGTLLLH